MANEAQCADGGPILWHYQSSHEFSVVSYQLKLVAESWRLMAESW
jgi:hypothetical protein